MKPARRLVLFVALVPLLAATGACTSMKTVSAPTEDALEAIDVGDTVRVVTADGRDLVLEVSSLEDRSLAGEVLEVRAAPDGDDIAPGQSRSFTLDELRTIQVKRIDGWKTAGYLGGSIAVGYLIGLVLVTALVIIPL